MDPFDEDDEVFLENEVSAELEEDLWSSPLMNYSSPFDDYKELFSDIAETPTRLKSIGYRSHSSSSTSSSRLPVPFDGPGRAAERCDDEPDFARPISNKVPHAKKGPSSVSSVGSAGSTKKSLGLSKAASGTGSSASSAGAVDEEFFIKSFEDVSKVQIFSSRDLTETLSKCKDTLADTNIAWEKRVEALKTLRSVLVAGGADYDEFYQYLRVLEPCFTNSLKDLRSQVVREGAITVAFYSQRLGSRFDHGAETLLPTLINLIPNSAKIMATSGVTCIRFILQYTYASRLIPVIIGNNSSKNSIIRRFCYEFLNQLLHTWPTHILEKHIALLQEAIKKGISDADSEARSFARKAFWGFADHFKDQADALLDKLDPAKRKALQGELSNSSSSNSVNSSERLSANRLRVRSASQDRGYETSTLGRGGKKGHHTRFRSARSDTGGDLDVDDLDGSQEANSRSSSPTPRHSYLTHTSGQAAPLTPSRPRKSSAASRSQGTSRETSPSRSATKSSGYGLPSRERRASGGRVSSKPVHMVPKTLRPGQDHEELLADALLRQPMRKRYESYDSDDNASETSSVCSERSFSSYGRTSEDMGEILGLLQSGSYQDRKEGLVCLQKILRQNRFLSRIELKKATEIFTRMFHDPHSKVFSLFLEALIDLIQLQSRDLNDWLYVLLSRLVNKLGGDMLGSIQAKVQRTLDVVRDNFPGDLQFNIITRFMIDQTQSPSLKVKLAMLTYLSGLVTVMDPSDFSNSSDTRLVVSRIITWTNEPKSVDVRKSAQSVLFGLFNLNPPEFSMMLSGLPKTFQDGATKILQSHLRANNEPDVLTPRNVASPQGQNRSRPPSRGPYGHDEADTENMNPEDIYNSIKKTSADIQNLSFNSKLDQYEDVKKRKDFTSQDSGIQDLRNDSPDAGDNRKPHYNPSHYQDENTINGYNKAALAEAVFDAQNEMSFNEGSIDQEDMITDILRELSNHNERNEERKSAMLTLIKFTRDGAFALWDEHFKSVLLILLETLGDDDLHIRSLALRVLREILRNQSQRFEEYAELTTLRILEAHRDPAKEVVRAGEECAATLASYIPPAQSIRILIPIIQTSDFPINLAAIKMQTKVVELMAAPALIPLLDELMPGLLKGYDDNESSVRKASVFCLVSIYLVVGEALRPHLSELNGSKVKLLNLYIKRAQAQRESGKVLSPHSSDTT